MNEFSHHSVLFSFWTLSTPSSAVFICSWHNLYQRNYATTTQDFIFISATYRYFENGAFLDQQWTAYMRCGSRWLNSMSAPPAAKFICLSRPSGMPISSLRVYVIAGCFFFFFLATISCVLSRPLVLHWIMQFGAPRILLVKMNSWVWMLFLFSSKKKKKTESLVQAPSKRRPCKTDRKCGSLQRSAGAQGLTPSSIRCASYLAVFCFVLDHQKSISLR